MSILIPAQGLSITIISTIQEVIMLTRAPALSLAAMVLLLAGCATVPPQAGFETVQDTIQERTQMRIHWMRGTTEDREAAEAVERLLSEPLTSDAAVQIALLNNPRLQATYEDLMVAQADLVAAGLLRNPVFSAEVKFIEAGGGTNIELSLVQSFLDILFIPMRERIAGAQFESAQQRVIGETLELARRTRIAYFNLQAAEQLVELHRQVLLATDAAYTLARRLREAGNIAELDLANERALYEQSKLDMSAAESLALQRREDLNTLMGTWGLRTDWTVLPRLPEPPPDDIDAVEAERLAIAQNPRMRSAERQVAAAGARLGIAGPEAVLAGTEVGVAAEREGDGTWSLGPSFAIPLPLWMQGRPATAAAEAELRRAQQLYSAAAVELRAQTRAAHMRMTAARQRVEYYQHIMLPLRQRITEESMLQYNAMQIGTFQLLMARQEQIRAGSALVEALREYWVARADLEWLLGGHVPEADEPGPLHPSEDDHE